MFRLCLKSLPAIRYRRLLSDYLDLKNGFRYQNIFACKYRGYIYRFKSTKPGLFKSLTETVNRKKEGGGVGREDVKLTDAKSQKLEEDKKLINKNKSSDGHLNLTTTDQNGKTVRPAEIYFKNNERKYFQSEQKNRDKGKASASPRKTQKIDQLSNSEDLFTNFQELLTLPQKSLFKYESKLSSKKNKEKDSGKVKKLTAKLKINSKKNVKYKPQPLAKNKKDPKIYENLNLLKEPEPQCDFLDLQSGKKRILIGGMNDFSPNLSKSNVQHTRTMTSQADRGIFSKKSPRKKIERLEKRLLLETPKIKAIKNRLSKMDRYWVIAAKKKRENKIPEAIMILRDRIRQQIEASKTFKYPVVMVDEPVKLAMATGGDDGRGSGSQDTFNVPRGDIPASQVLEKVKIMNRKLKDTPYIPPIVERKKHEMKKSSSGKFYLKKMKKQKVEKVPEVKKVEEEKPVKLYSDKIREKIMKAQEKYKPQAEGVQEEVQNNPENISGLETASQTVENPTEQAEIVATTEKPPEGSAEAPKIEEAVKDEPKDPLPPVSSVQDVPEVPKPKQKFPHYTHRIPIFTRSPNVWAIRPYAPPEEAPADVKPAMTLTSAMEGFNLNSDVQRIILKAKAKAMGVQVPEEEKKIIEEPPKKLEEKKKIEIVRKSTFFASKPKKSVGKEKVKESIMSVDKTEPVILPEVVKRTRVPVRIPEHAIQNPPSTTDPNERTPTQEETARNIRKWFLYGRTGEDPKPIVEKKSNDVEINKTSGEESPFPTEEKIQSEDSVKGEGEVKKGSKSKEMILEMERDGKSKEMVLKPERNVKSKEMVLGPRGEKRTKKIAYPPSGFRTPRITDPRMQQRPEQPREHRRQERISDPPKAPQKILDPPREEKTRQKISDPPREEKTQERISEPPSDQKAPEKISDPPSKQKPPESISEPTSERTPERISDPPNQQSTAEKISDPPREPVTPQKISDPEDRKPEKISDSQSEDRPQQKISEPPSKSGQPERISDPPSEQKPPLKMLSSPSDIAILEEILDQPIENILPPQVSEVSKPPDPVKKPQPPQKISRSPSEPRKLQKITEPELKFSLKMSPRESKTQPKISGSATLPRMGQKISVEPKILPKISHPPAEPKTPQKVGDPPVQEYRVWVPSDETFKKKLAESAEASKRPEPRNEAAILAKKLSAIRSDIKVRRTVEMNMKKETIQVPRKPEMRITKQPEKVVKAKVEPARKASVEITKQRDIARVEKKIYWKPEMDKKIVNEPSRKASAEVAKAKEMAKIEKNVQKVVEPAKKASLELTKTKDMTKIEKDVQWKTEMDRFNDQNLRKLKIVHVVSTTKPEAAAKVAKPQKKLEPKSEERRVHAQESVNLNAEQVASDTKAEAAAMKAAEVAKSLEVLATAEKMLKAKREGLMDVQNSGNPASGHVEGSRHKVKPVKIVRIPSASELQAQAAENFSNFDLPKIEELIKPEEKDLPHPKPILASPDPSAKIDEIITSKPEIAKSVKKDPKVENEEPEVLKGAINIKLKPLSEIESLTKAVSTKPGNFEKVEDVKGSASSSSSSRGIDELEKIISKKIETIPCVKPKLPPYYYTPYSSSTVEPDEELTNKKKDKNDDK